MLIDDFLPTYDVTERHQVRVHASPEEAYAAVRKLDISDARLTRQLFRLRGIPTSSKFTLDDLLKMRFILLGENTNEELLLGLVGRFWTPSGQLRRVTPEEYRSFSESGVAKAAWNFSVSQQIDGTVLLRTETRVYCSDDASRRRFRLYWMMIGAFSGLIRKEILRNVKRNAERPRSLAA